MYHETSDTRLSYLCLELNHSTVIECYYMHHSTTIVYLTSPEPSKNCYNLFTLHPIEKMLTPLESSQPFRSGDILHYTWNLTLQILAVCAIKKVCRYHWSQGI